MRKNVLNCERSSVKDESISLDDIPSAFVKKRVCSLEMMSRIGTEKHNCNLK
jgi:hypothetical protein